ncbi:MAG: ABC-F family ATP-binding cassette domain-containing protein [Caldilineales bacterium]|nr:ABC-F family ATP-binding cassette domain-containing protein [Caldilineales bacterium]
MIAVHLDRVSVSYGTGPVFLDLSWDIHDDRKVGLVGANGCGKSTLLRLLAGELQTETGYFVPRQDVRIGYLAQEPRLNPAHSVWAEALTASNELAEVEARLERIETQLADPTVYGNSARLERTLERQARQLEEFERLGGPGYESRVRSVLLRLGFDENDLALPTPALSGGQKKLLGLAKLLITAPELLLLDEPDNHLDLTGKTLLEETIRNYAGAVIIVSHDRYLLDVVVDEIAELEHGRLTQYPGNYSEYAFEKQTRLLRRQQLYEVQSREIRRLEQAAQRLLTWGRAHDNEDLIRRGKNIERRIERIERIEKPVLENKRMGLELKGWRGSNKVLEIVDLQKSFSTSQNGSQTVLAGLDLLIWHGERVGLVGANGSGKSVLFRLILNQDDADEGIIKIGPSVVIGHYSQEHETLDYERSLLDTVRRSGQFTESAAVNFLGRFLFNYEQSRGPVGNLSGGERSRLQLALLMLSGANFLLLDEPTNNLDITSTEVLEEALADFEGTVLVISHDRYFLDRVSERIVEIEDGGLVEYAGNFSDYQAAKDESKRRP